MQKGDKYFTFDLHWLDEKSIKQDNPFIVSEHEFQGGFEAESVTEMGMVYDTMDKAMKAARQFYYRRKFEKLGRPYDSAAEYNYAVIYDRSDQKIHVVDMCPVPNGVYFDTKEDAMNAVNQFPLDIFAHYVLSLFDVVVCVEQRV